VKKRLLSIFTVLALLVALVPHAAFAQGTVTLDDISDKVPGENVTIAGTANISEVTIKVIRPDNTILYVDVVGVSGNSYSKTFKLPGDAAEGEYKVVVGRGEVVARTSFNVDATPPTAPTNLRVTAKTSSNVTLAWDASTDNFGVAKYVIEMKQSGGQFQVAGESTTNSFTKSGLAASTTYIFRVKAVDVAGNESSWSNEASVTTAAAPTGGGGAPAPTAEKTEKPIQPGTTTVAELPGKVRIEVPPDAVAGTNVLIIAEVVSDEKASGAGMPLLGKVVDITLKNGTLTGKITIILYFDKNKLGKDQEPVAFYYDEKAGKWVRLDGTVDPDKGTITVVVDHLTLFAVFAVAKEVPKPPAKPTFLDMAGHWAEETVSELAYRGIISGYPDGTFLPDKTVTRAEIAALLVRALKLAPGSDQDLKFKDNATIPAWARSAVAAAVREGLVKGYPQRDGTVTFEAKRSLSRTEMACLVARVIEGKLGAITPAELTFADAAKIPAWARSGIGIAVAQGIISGYPDGTFRGEKPVTRAEAATMILRLLEVLGEN
jgi:chitodextrinase